MPKHLALRTEIITDPTHLPSQWDDLLAQQSMPTPFMQRHYLSAMHQSQSAHPTTGWNPQFVLLWNQHELYAACPLYLKTHSWGEYVFDQAWAQAYERAGLNYYPKYVCAVPFTPVQGSRLLAVDDHAKLTLLQTIQDLTHQKNVSSTHLLFASPEDLTHAQMAHWSFRQTVQFHWHNHNYIDFEQFLKTLTQDKAKKARAEMRKVKDTGVQWRYVLSPQLNDLELELLTKCYTQTYLEHGKEPYLNLDFFKTVLADSSQHWLLCIASHDAYPGKDFACSLIALDPKQKTAYGRYWGALARVSCLHFDACYYQPIQWCIANGYQRFEGGAQGEHKMARGLLPELSSSAHYLANPQFAKAVKNYTEHEKNGVTQYMTHLHVSAPYK